MDTTSKHMKKNNYKPKFGLLEMPYEARMLLVLALGLAACFLILFLEKTILPYPVILEESFKAVLVLYLVCGPEKNLQKIKAAIMLGAIIGFSENLFYLASSLDYSLQLFWQRTLITLPMHILTTVIILLSALKHQYLIVFGWGAGILIHFVFNNQISIWITTILNITI